MYQLVQDFFHHTMSCPKKARETATIPTCITGVSARALATSDTWQSDWMALPGWIVESSINWVVTNPNWSFGRSSTLTSYDVVVGCLRLAINCVFLFAATGGLWSISLYLTEETYVFILIIAPGCGYMGSAEFHMRCLSTFDEWK